MMAGHRIQLPAFKLMIRQHSIIITVGRRRQRRFLIWVRRLHMLPHMRCRHKRFGAEGAMVGLLAGVHSLMLLQVAQLHKRSGAQRTYERLLIRVDQNVSVKRRRLRE